MTSVMGRSVLLRGRFLGNRAPSSAAPSTHCLLKPTETALARTGFDYRPSFDAAASLGMAERRLGYRGRYRRPVNIAHVGISLQMGIYAWWTGGDRKTTLARLAEDAT